MEERSGSCRELRAPTSTLTETAFHLQGLLKPRPLKLAFSPIPLLCIAKALQRTKADYSIAIVTFTKINHLLEKLPGTTCKICLPLLPMHMSLWYVHMEQNIHRIKTSFRLSAVSNDGAFHSIWLTADQGRSLWLTGDAPFEALQTNRWRAGSKQSSRILSFWLLLIPYPWL